MIHLLNQSRCTKVIECGRTFLFFRKCNVAGVALSSSVHNYLPLRAVEDSQYGKKRNLRVNPKNSGQHDETQSAQNNSL